MLVLRISVMAHRHLRNSPEDDSLYWCHLIAWHIFVNLIDNLSVSLSISWQSRTVVFSEHTAVSQESSFKMAMTASNLRSLLNHVLVNFVTVYVLFHFYFQFLSRKELINWSISQSIDQSIYLSINLSIGLSIIVRSDHQVAKTTVFSGVKLRLPLFLNFLRKSRLEAHAYCALLSNHNNNNIYLYQRGKKIRNMQ